MSRWNDTVTLVSLPDAYQDSMGAWHEGEPEETEVFCNQYSAGLSDTTDPDRGLTDVAEVQLRNEDYADQTKAVYHGREYSVASVTRSATFCRIRLERGVADG